jgi:hypothetical protein
MDRNFVGDRKSRRAINAVLNIPGSITWTAAQQEVIKSLLEFPDRLLFIQGFPGTDKSLALMGITAVCPSARHSRHLYHSHSDKFMQLTHMSMDILRLYMRLSEARASKPTEGRQER